MEKKKKSKKKNVTVIEAQENEPIVEVETKQEVTEIKPTKVSRLDLVKNFIKSKLK
jgi:hypothetical protein